MKPVHPAAEWAPSRFDFALARLIAYVRASRSLANDPEQRRVSAYAFHAGNNRVEPVIVSALFVLVAALFYAAVALELESRVARWILLTLTPLLGFMHWNVSIPLTSLFLVPLVRLNAVRNVTAAQSTVQLANAVTLAIFIVKIDGPLRLAGAAIVALVVMNMIAALANLVLRDRINALDARLRE